MTEEDTQNVMTCNVNICNVQCFNHLLVVVSFQDQFIVVSPKGARTLSCGFLVEEVPKIE